MPTNPLPRLTSRPSLNDFHISFGHPPPIVGAGTTFRRSFDSADSSRVSWDDPTWKIIPIALKTYKHNNHYHDDNWENYAMLICYGPHHDRTEMCLSYDEKPLLVFQKLKNADKNPVFVLKHVKDIPSPIAAVQQRRLTQATSRHVSTEAKSRNQDLASRSATRTPVEDLRSLLGTIIPASTGRGSKREMPPPLAVVSYAIAVYPYAAEQEDELNVAVGDSFVIISRLYDWLVVQRDPVGTGVVSTDRSMRGWVPDGCFLEIGIPVASAVAEATASASSTRASRAPILPRSITSSNFPGFALMDYKRRGQEEVNLIKGETMRIFKVYDHWCYAVKDNGDRGWVPAWFVGKVTRIQNTSSASGTSNALMLSFGNTN